MDLLRDFIDKDFIQIIFVIALFVLFAVLLRSDYRHRRNKYIHLSDDLVGVKIDKKLPKAQKSIFDIDRERFLFIAETASETISIYFPVSLMNPVREKIIVQHGGALLFYGTSSNDLVINQGGSAIIYGTIVGAVTNNGGELHIYGKIVGVLSTAFSGETKIYSTAQILSAES